MKLATIIYTAWLCLAAYTSPVQLDLLNRRVSLSYHNATIVEVLQGIQEEYDIRFSYLNNEIPDSIEVSINLQNQPLYLALDKLLEETQISYQVVSGQVILKNNPQKARKQVRLPQTQEKTTAPSPKAAPKLPSESSRTKDIEKDTIQAESEKTATASINKATPPITLPEENNIEETPSSTPLSIEEEKVEKLPDTQNKRHTIPTNKKEDTNVLGEKLKKVGVGLRNLFQKIPGEDEDDYERKSFHLGLIYPLSTNGASAGKYVNELSLHLLVGYAAGLDGVEFSGFGNIENDFMNGAQFGGFFNVVKNDVDGAQFAGFLNVNGGNMKGAQLSGFLNTAASEVEGVQSSGFMNMATGKTKGAQLAGFMNVITDDANAFQGAGFANFVSGDLEGGQGSGFINYSHDVNVQLAGFMNIASGDVNGLQASVFMNFARNLKGLQLGVFNVADSVDGLPIGFLSIVRKNGYRKLEIWSSESMHANAGFKIGVEKFYNIFAITSQFAADDFRWGFGYGAGTQFSLASRDFLNIELLSFQIQEGEDQIFEETQLNLLNTFKIGYTHQFSEHFGIAVAPTFNVMVSQRENFSDGSIGSDLALWTTFDRTYNNKTNVKMWPGFHVGLRF
ncbi:STN domain-containing protein [Porifericola rhodea]|uniref:STN domain-containing protein n=1 Tax=Porifericola rhodea TaxID=930972 RepID=UPI0026669C46|nr:STN domain-containing protein [Porifericola rhodea]WKN33681.1 STN domain-containing protein [Porifericola rhodea]